jgi:hypothetical protein
MKKLALTLLLALPLAVVAGTGGWFQGTFDEAKAAAKAQDRNLVLKFYADW